MISAVLPTYARADLAFDRGEGPYLFTETGERYLDFASGVAVTALGHSHPRLVAALTEQAGKVWHTSNVFRVKGQETLAAKLVEHTFADTVFFANSGAEAIECAVKMVRKHFHAAGQPERNRIIACEGAFHGRTLATLAAAGNPKYLAGFDPKVEGFDHVAFGNMNELRNAIGPTTAGILVEPVQGEGGIRAADPAYLRALREVADEFGLLLVFDEVQCGMGRTGKLFAHEWAGITPDVMAIAKGLGGGFPVGACLATEAAASGMTAGSHGSTFGGNPLAMAVAIAVVDVITAPGFLDGVQRAAAILHDKIAAVVARRPAVFEELRGAGLMLGLKCAPTVQSGEMVAALRKAGLLTVGAGENVVRLLPPLIIGEAEADEAARIIDAVAAAWPAPTVAGTGAA